MTRILLTTATIAIAIQLAGAAWANATVYKCNGVYTDQPCKDGREVDIAPTEGLDKLSSRPRKSHDAQMREISRTINKSVGEGHTKAGVILQCQSLLRERRAIDGSGGSKDRRFAIRQQQHALNCRDQ